MPTSATVEIEGARIFYEFAGDGPALLTIAGAGGSGMSYGSIARILADEYTVITYDRRSNGRSSGDVTGSLDMAQSARDAGAVIRALGVERAHIFGNSGGAEIGLKLAEVMPEVVGTLIAHEPPVGAILPDGEQWLGFVRRVHETYQTMGLYPAMGMFMGSLVGFDGPPPAGGDGPGPDMDFFMANEYVPFSTFVPDVDAIARNKVNVVTAAGRRSADAPYARTARLIAERLGCPYVEFPGNHLSFFSDPEPFAEALRTTLRTYGG